VAKEPTDVEFFEGRDAYLADPEGNYWKSPGHPTPTRSSRRPAAPPASPSTI